MNPENVLRIAGREWPIPEEGFTRDEVRSLKALAGRRTVRGLSRAIKRGDERACAAYVLTLLRRTDPEATLADARREIGIA